MKNNFPKSLKFLKPNIEDAILSNDYFSTVQGHYILKASWVLSCPKNRYLGLSPLVNIITKYRLKLVEARVKGLETNQKDLESIVKKIDLSTYKETPRENIAFLKGYKKPNIYSEDFTHISIKSGRYKTYLDIKYAPVLFFDNTTKILEAGSGYSPILLVKDSSLVAAIAPLNREKIEENYGK